MGTLPAILNVSVIFYKEVGDVAPLSKKGVAILGVVADLGVQRTKSSRVGDIVFECGESQWKLMRLYDNQGKSEML